MKIEALKKYINRKIEANGFGKTEIVKKAKQNKTSTLSILSLLRGSLN